MRVGCYQATGIKRRTSFLFSAQPAKDRTGPFLLLLMVHVHRQTGGRTDGQFFGIASPFLLCVCGPPRSDPRLVHSPIN